MSPEEALEHARLAVVQKTEAHRLAKLSAKEARASLLESTAKVRQAEADQMRADVDDDVAQYGLATAHGELAEAHRVLHDLVCGCGKAPPQDAATKPALN